MRKITTKEAGRLVERDSSNIRRKLILGKIKGEKFGRDWLVDLDSLVEFYSKKEKKAKKEE